MVRPATAGEVEAIVRLVNEAYHLAERHFTDELRTDVGEVSELVARGEFLVLEAEQGLVGAVHLHIEGDQGHFGMLAVAPAYQRQGFGRRLVEAVEEHCLAHGCREVHLEAVDARVELPGWYARMGYIEYGTAPYVRPPEQCKMPVHFILMKKHLAVPATPPH